MCIDCDLLIAVSCFFSSHIVCLSMQFHRRRHIMQFKRCIIYLHSHSQRSAVAILTIFLYTCRSSLSPTIQENLDHICEIVRGNNRFRSLDRNKGHCYKRRKLVGICGGLNEHSVATARLSSKRN